MIIDVPWHRGTVRVGFQEQFPFTIESENWLVDRVPATSSGSHELRRLWIEVVRNTGPRTLFAMLGAEGRPASSAESIIRVPVLEESNRPYISRLAADLNAVIALPIEFGEAVLETAKRTIDRRVNHEMVFASAAHTAVGSSPQLFGQAASVICTLLSENLDLGALPERVQEVVSREFK